MDSDALYIATELYTWAYLETNRIKASKLYKLAKKYEKIWNDR